jgi:hypothetical protein
MSETQPYRLFKEFLDTIIQIPENIKTKLADEFERRRIEIQENKLPKNKSMFGQEEEEPKQEEEEPKQEEEEPKQEEEEEEPKQEEEEEEPKQEEEEPKDATENKSYFDSIFSKKEKGDMLEKFSTSKLKERCKIRGW